MTRAEIAESEILLLREIHNLAIGQVELPSEVAKTDELNRSIELFSRAICLTHDAIWDWNLKTDEVYCSPGLKKLLGYREDELKNKVGTWLGLIHPEDKERILEQTRDFLAGNQDLLESELRMLHKSGKVIYVQTRTYLVDPNGDGIPTHITGTHIDVTEEKKKESFEKKNSEVLKMVAVGYPASDIYDAIAHMYEERHPGMRCSMLELDKDTLLHGGAPSLPQEYCDAVHGLKYGPEVGSCGTSTYTGKQVLVEDIESDPKWADLKAYALPHGLRSCWSEPIKAPSGRVLGAFGMYYNHPGLPNDQESADLKSAARLTGIVMERDYSQKRIRQLAYTDELTGLGSRAYFYQSLEVLIKKSKHNNSQFWVLYLDVDEFKAVNDDLGHDVGDAVLKETASRLTSVSRDIDVVARLSGDEFCVLIPNEGSIKEAEIPERYINKINEPMELSSRKLTLTSSIGIARYPDDAEDISLLMKAADTALYAAKGLGKNQHVFYDPELAQKEKSRLKFEQCLRDAPENQQFSVVYQPQIDIKTGEVVGMEALSRWTHPDYGEVSPSDFIAAAERIGVIKQLTESIVLASCRQAVAWKEAGFTNLRMGVNISPSYFRDKEIVSFISRTLEETGMDPTALELEITESLVQIDQQNLSIIQQLDDLGVNLAIDDFGTGYSSFASLKHLKTSRLKIDKYFIDDMLSDEQVRLLLASMIEMGHNLGQEIVAEGIESAEQVEILKGLGCDVLQGNLFSPPNEADAVFKELGKKHLPLN